MAGTFTTRNTPILAASDGTQSETLAGTQLLSGLFSVPVNANSAWLQPATDILFRLDGSTSGSAWLTLPAKTFLPLTNRSQLEALVLSGSSQVGVIFMEGALGPMPPAPIVASTGGGGVPGEGTVTSVDVFSDIDETGFEHSGGPITASGTIVMTGRARVDTTNAVHVMVTGDDGTGLRGRLDKPFETIAAAVAAMEEEDTLYVWPGNYVAENIELSNVNVYLIGAQLYATFDVPYMFKVSNAVAITSEGDSRLFHEGGSGCRLFFCDAIDTQLIVEVPYLQNDEGGIAQGGGEACQLYIKAQLIQTGTTNDAGILGWELSRVEAEFNSSGIFSYAVQSGETYFHVGNIYGVDLAVDINDGDFELRGNLECINGNGEAGIRTNGQARLRVYGNITTSGGIPCIRVENGGSDIEVHGSLFAGDDVPAVSCDDPTIASVVNIFGNVESEGAGVFLRSGRVAVNGDMTCAAQCIYVNASDCTVQVNGKLTTTTTANAAVFIEEGRAQIDIYGDIRNLSTGAVLITDTADTEGNVINVYGNILSQNQHGVWAYTGRVNVFGDINVQGVITDSNAVHALGDAKVYVHGNLFSNGGAAAKTSDPDAIIEVFGNAYSANRWGAFCIAGGHVIVHGVAESGFREGAYCEIGKITLLGGAKAANNSSAVIMLSQEVVAGNVLTLGGGCFLESSGTALYAVDCDPGGINGVRSYGAYGNKPLEPTLVPVGTFNVV